MAITFEDLCRCEMDDLEKHLKAGATPRLEEVAGAEFRGFNHQPATVIIGTRKFKKGFYGDPRQEYLWGYNVLVQQNDLSERWIAKPSDNDPNRQYFFKVWPAGARKDSPYPKALVVDYSGWDGYAKIDPVGYTVDYLSFPDPDNRKLMVGKSYAEVGSIKVFLGFFILEQYNATLYVGPPYYP